MDILRFTLSGSQAFFKKPDVNAYCYFTYGHIHKVALLGLFGAVLGYGGYNSMKKEDDYPEFYEKLQDLHIAVLPVCEKGSFDKKVIEFNNSVGYASREQGGNLIVKQQWLENPKWQIYLLIDCDESRKIADAMLKRKCVYLPYLGSNSHPADISDVDIISGTVEEYPQYLESMYIKKYVEADMQNEEEDWFKYEENLPVALDRQLNMYKFETIVFSDMKILKCNTNTGNIYKVHDKYSEIQKKDINLMFF